MNLFDLSHTVAFSVPPATRLEEGHPAKHHEVSKARLRLAELEDPNDPRWLLKASEQTLFWGDTTRSLEWANRLRAIASEESLRMRARLTIMNVHLALARGEAADATLDEMREAAYRPEATRYVRAIYQFARVWRETLNPHGTGPSAGDAAECIDILADVAEAFELEEDFELAIRALTKQARIMFMNGRFFRAMELSDRIATLILTHGFWQHLGRLQTLMVMNAVDQGYRRGVREALEGVLAWTTYVGDVVGRIDALLARGRMEGYVMPEGDVSLANVPDQYCLEAARIAEAHEFTWVLATIDSVRSWLYEKAGDLELSRRLLRADVEEVSDRERLAKKRSEDHARFQEHVVLKSASRLYDGIQDSSDPFFVFDALRGSDGECRDFNTMFHNAAGRRIYEGAGAQVFLYSEARRLPHLAGLDRAIDAVLSDHRPFEDLHEVLLEGQTRFLQRRVLSSGDGFVVSIRDVTAEKRIESALRMAAESAERSEKTKTAFLASMSHEIRTPLNGVLGLARMLAETHLDPTQRAYVDDIVLSGDLLLALIGDILDLSKIESQEMRLAPTRISLPLLVSSIVKLFRGQAEEKGVSLSFRIDSATPEHVTADGVRLRQILANLVGNAVKFTPRGEVEIRVSSSSQSLRFEVRDSGIGIPPDRLASIFDRFQQASDPGYGGTGLGLTITKALCELMGGVIQVESVEGAGSRFTVTLPLAADAAEAAHLEPSRNLRFDGTRVLLVDDNRVNVLVSTHALRKYGCEIVCAEDGRKALERMSEQPFDIVFMDVRMPNMNGLEATREWRRREAGKGRTPVVALTAGALLQEQEECFAAGMDDFATKPITADSIREVLAKWLTPSEVG